MIPKNIRRTHILSAIQEIDRNGVPKQRKSRKYHLVLSGKQYPPKYVVALANKYANGEILKSSEFGGGSETNGVLGKLGFTITDKTFPAKEKPKPGPKKILKKRPTTVHNERCPACKQTVEAMLQSLYGKVRSNYRFEMGVIPEDFIGTLQYQNLSKIYSALQDHRGYQEFVRTENLPRVDYYIPDPGFILEFDESQHFTSSRKAALSNYPDSLDTRFNTSRWMNLCDQINAGDNDPPFRDEQRAWYDTLRDFLPEFRGLLPTIRIFSQDMQWCSLNPSNKNDLLYFQQFLEVESSSWRIEVQHDPSPDLARVVIAGPWAGEIEPARTLLVETCERWPVDKRVDCLMTCGAFIKFYWPQSLYEVGDNKYPDQVAVETLISAAETECKSLLGPQLRKNLLEHANYITIGVDSKKDKISLSNVSIRSLHIELVALVDLQTNQYQWTGKSYPTTGQQEGLVRIQDPSTHFKKLPFGRVMILGCHDLALFHPRGKATTKSSWRKEIRREFYNLLETEKPDIVLHHPHTTDSARTWLPAWNELERAADSIKQYLGTGIYYNNGGERSPLEEVLRKTKKGQSIDFIFHT